MKDYVEKYRYSTGYKNIVLRGIITWIQIY